MTEETVIRTRISKGYQVVVPSALRKRVNVEVGDEVCWVISDKGVTTQFRKRPSLNNLVGLGSSGAKENSVELKKRIQKGEF